jgi:hypothetical protein
MNYHGVEISPAPIEQFCRRHHIRRLSAYGSILRDDFGPEKKVRGTFFCALKCVGGLPQSLVDAGD